MRLRAFETVYMGLGSSAPSTTEDYSRRIAEAVTSNAPIGDILQAATASAGADNYALLRFFDNPSSCAVVSSSVLEFDSSGLPNETLNPATTEVRLADPRVSAGFKIPEFSVITAFPIGASTRLVFFSKCPLKVSEKAARLVTNVLSFILGRFPYDPSFLLARVGRFSEGAIARLGTRGFSIDTLNDDEILLHMIAIFYAIIDELDVDKDEFVRFVVDIRGHYNQVPYHNWRHAADTTQFVFSVIRNANVGKYLSKREIFAVLLSAVCHDTDHDGLNNTYQRKARTVLAQLAPNLPPLEVHHADVAMNALNLCHSRVLSKWSELEIAYFQKFVVSCILATDMDKHKAFVEEFAKTKAVFDKENEEHRILLGQIIMKAADLSNTVRDFDDAATMTERLMDECFKQGDRETSLGLEVSPMCDRKKAAPIPVGQIGFYRFVAGPLMAELHAFFPELDENEKQYQLNLAKWTEMKDSMSE